MSGWPSLGTLWKGHLIGPKLCSRTDHIAPLSDHCPFGPPKLIVFVYDFDVFWEIMAFPRLRTV